RNVTGCTDAAHVTISVPYPASGKLWAALPNCDAGCAGLSYTFGWDGDAGYSVWSYSAAPANYYDNAVGFYTLYYRTGIDDYLVAARQLTDEWWENPMMDQGGACEIFKSNSQQCWPNRSLSLFGLLIRASVDGQSHMWPGMRIIWDRLRFLLGIYGGVTDK